MVSRSSRLALVIASLAAAASGAAAEPPAARPMSPPPPPAIPPAIAARLPAQGILVAHTTDLGDADVFRITRIDRGGARELVRDALLPDEMTWLDPRTLVTVTTDIVTDTSKLRRYVDGVEDPSPMVVDPDVWQLPEGKTLADTRAPELWVGKGGALWLARCHTRRERGRMEVCTGRAWVRVDGGARAVKKKPAGARRAGPAVPSLEDGKLPRGVAAPAGYAVELTRVTVVDDGARETVKGFVCRGPGGASATWPTAAVIDWQFAVRPTRLTWLTATPPMFAVTGKETNPIGEVTTESRVFRACQPGAIDDVVWLGDSRRFEMKMVWRGDRYAGTTWTLFVDDVAVAVLAGSPAGVQVAPLP